LKIGSSFCVSLKIVKPHLMKHISITRISMTQIFVALAIGAAWSTPGAWAQDEAQIGASLPPAPAASSTGAPSTGVVTELPPPPNATQNADVAMGHVTAISSPVPYYIDRGTTMVPIRPLCEFLGVKIGTADGVLSFTQELPDEPERFRVVTLRVGGRSAQLSERGTTRKIALQLPAETRLGNTFLPLRFVRDAFDATIGFRKRDNALVIEDGNKRGVLTPPSFKDYKGANASTLTIVNRVGRALSLRLGGPQSLVLELGKGQSVTRKLKPGVYYYKADSTGMKPRSGARRMVGRQRSTWSWGRR
jgi:hypothetical protein